MKLKVKRKLAKLRKKKATLVTKRDLKSYDDADKPRIPKRATPYVGIEIECFSEDSSITTTDIQELILENDMEAYVNVGIDGSIDTPHDEQDGDGFYTDNGFELRLLIPEKKLEIILNKLKKVIKKAKLTVNESCGLHVHLDMRHRNMPVCYKKLLKFQDVLFSMVDRGRWYNTYCRYSSKENEYHRYVAINKTSFISKRTIEVRLHQGTIDTKEIFRWCNLLVNIIGAKKHPPIKSKDALLNWKELDPNLKSYIDDKFNSSWFETNPVLEI